MELSKENRIVSLDIIRGVSIVYVVIYHLLYDLDAIFGTSVPFLYSSWMQWLHYMCLFSLIVVSGICTGFSKNIFQRGSLYFVLGFLFTVFTGIIMPDEVVVFGVLSFFGSSMIVYGLIAPLVDKIPWILRVLGYGLLYVSSIQFAAMRGFSLFDFKVRLPDYLYQLDYLYPIGICSSSFQSSDYFPMIPWFFLFLIGTALSKPVIQKKLPSGFYKWRNPILAWLGKKSLWIYLFHQPIIYIVLKIIFSL